MTHSPHSCSCAHTDTPGLTIQRKSHVVDEALPPEERRRAVRRPLWIIGFAVYISSNIFGSGECERTLLSGGGWYEPTNSSVFQIGALPIVVLAPLGGISLLWNSLLAHAILGEGFSRSMMLGTVFIATGAVLIAIFGVVPDSNHSLDELLALWSRGPFLIFFSAVCVAVVTVLAAAHLAVWRVKRTDHIRLPDNDTPSNYASPRSIPPIPFRPTLNNGPGGGIVLEDSGNISPISAIHPIDTKIVRFAGVGDDLVAPL